ncbi:EF-hand calcium-binding domain-containing protein 4B isoform X2 [Octopus bimaculoides]|uniref:EF-hand calcium-binding domain-containing protein 4B isoform X2 n=1 Tax=Octopus bimaculoides TaxID=37653 RepID=UPI0022DFB2D7|nr:EF-hand calcium-binding domain-containing protein 4B isoform X2 [Octopus bimaculoides]
MESMEQDSLDINKSMGSLSEMDPSAICSMNLESGVDPENIGVSRKNEKEEENLKQKGQGNEEKIDESDINKSELAKDGDIGQSAENKKSGNQFSCETETSGEITKVQSVDDISSNTAVAIDSSEVKCVEAGEEEKKEKEDKEEKETEGKEEKEEERNEKKIEESGKGEKMEEVTVAEANEKGRDNPSGEQVTEDRHLSEDSVEAKTKDKDISSQLAAEQSPLGQPATVDFVTLEDAPRLEKPITSIKEMETSGIEKKEHLYKILVIGELGTGKTSIIKRYVHQFFSQHYRATIGVDFALKVISWDADTLIRLQLWDIAGQERFGNMTRVYYKEAVGAFVVFDVTRVPTFEAVVKWKNDLDSKVQLPDGSNIPCVLLANKCDQTKEGLVNNTEQMDDFCKEKGFLSWFETSAKENINIDEAARFLVGQILKNDQNMNTGSTEEDKERIQLANANQQEPTKKSCCR